MRSYRITTEPYILEGKDEIEAIEKWFQFIQFTGFHLQEYQGSEPIGEKVNYRLVIAENSTGGQLIISVKDESKADMIVANQNLRKSIQDKMKQIDEDISMYKGKNPTLFESRKLLKSILQELLDNSTRKK